MSLCSTEICLPDSIFTLASHRGKDISFNKWGGFSSLDGFDNFYGRDNFVGFCDNYVFVKQDKELVCRSEAIKIVQQRLLVIQELAKRSVDLFQAKCWALFKFDVL